MNEENIVEDKVVVGYQATFYTKCENPGDVSENNSVDEKIGQEEKGKYFISACVKHSGSLMLIDRDGCASSKHSADPRFTRITRLLFDAWMGSETEEFTEFLRKNMLSIGLELVIPHILGDHCEIPKLPYFAVTCISNLKTGKHLQLNELVQFCRDNVLPHGEYWFIPTNKKISDPMALRNIIGDHISNTSTLKCEMNRLTKEHDDGIVVSGNIPHEKVQGDLVEGILASKIKVPTDYKLLVESQHPNYDGKAEKRFSALEKMGIWLSDCYQKNKCEITGRPNNDFWLAIDKKIEESGVNRRLPEKRLLDKENEFCKDKTKGEILDWFLRQLAKSKNQVAQSHIEDMLKLRSSQLERKLKMLTNKAGKKFLGDSNSSKETTRIKTCQSLLQDNSRFTESLELLKFKELFSVKVYPFTPMKEGQIKKYSCHLKVEDDRLLMKHPEIRIGRGHILSVEIDNNKLRSSLELECDNNVACYFKRSERVEKVTTTLKIKNPEYIARRGMREATYALEKALSEKVGKKNKNNVTKINTEYKEIFEEAFKHAIAPLFTESEEDVKARKALLNNKKVLVNQLCNYWLSSTVEPSLKKITTENKEDFLKSYFLTAYGKFTLLPQLEKEKLAEERQQTSARSLSNAVNEGVAASSSLFFDSPTSSAQARQADEVSPPVCMKSN